MSKNRWRYFRWTPRTAFITFMYVGFVPGVLGYFFSRTDVGFAISGKKSNGCREDC